MKIKTALLAVITLTGCTTTSQNYSTGDYSHESPSEKASKLTADQIIRYAEFNEKYLQTNTEQKLIEETQNIAKKDLKDPDSAQFRNIRVVAHSNGKVVCGEINAKNSYGGYGGFSIFAGSPFGVTMPYTGRISADFIQAVNSPLYQACL